MLAKDFETKNLKFQRAQKIVMELISTLDIRNGGEIATNLLSLYTFVLNELTEGNVSDKTVHIDNAYRTMSDLRESWAELERNHVNGRGQNHHAA